MEITAARCVVVGASGLVVEGRPVERYNLQHQRVEVLDLLGADIRNGMQVARR
jgi:hypothetical protein